MLKIERFTCEHLSENCITDEAHPHFSFSVASSHEQVSIAKAKLSMNGWQVETDQQIAIPYEGKPLEAFTVYEAQLMVKDSKGEVGHKTLRVETGRMGTPWKAKWISDKTYVFKEKKVSPIPMMFRKTFSAHKAIKSARIYGTAMGIYELQLNGQKVGDQFFAPGFTAYKTNLQYQTYDVTDLLSDQNTLHGVVAGGWAVGSFVFTRKNRITADRQALLLELRITYEDGSVDTIGTDDSWEVTEEGNYRMADFYDGEVYDATIDINKITWKQATYETLKINPRIQADYGSPVKLQETMEAVSVTKQGKTHIYDFGQNMAGLVCLEIMGKKNQVITIKHAEILNPDGSLNTRFLRTAKASLTYTCYEGRQSYMPRLTYMGFRYISLEGIDPEDVQITVRALYSDLESIGSFTCSNPMLNRLHDNILWSAKSNFVDIPTDCPQRDERMGWTGDIAVFAPTACYQFDMSRFLEKWLADVRAEQRKTGGIPNTVPVQGYGFPATMPVMAVDFWGDAAILVPWAQYQASGDRRFLENNYDMMKRYVDACKFWAGLLSFGNKRYIWHTFHSLHFGDWIAPDVPKMNQWQKRSPYTATASLKNTSGLVAKVAHILGHTEDAKKYKDISQKTAQAYSQVLTDGRGKMNESFQTAYVLSIVYDLVEPKAKEAALKHLVDLIEENDYCIGTGFPGTPYILFALADNGYASLAYKMLLNTKSPSWLYEVKMGATTVWERWDGLDEDGKCPISDDGTDEMISYNHYASGAVGDFLYKRIAGIEAIEPGYKVFKIAPLIGGDLKEAEGSLMSPYGLIKSHWWIDDQNLSIEVSVPVGTSCQLYIGKERHDLGSGHYTYTVSMTA